ncbi:MAG: hypothetical protein K2Q01_05495 [Rickettsiales bacterium]|nr:hypothetical protein [Rickettsiales bacterium]
MANTSANASGKWIGVALVVILGVMAYGVLTMPDNRTTAERVGDAVSELPNGVDNAARQLEDRTPGKRLGDAVSDVGEEIRENTDSD